MNKKAPRNFVERLAEAYVASGARPHFSAANTARLMNSRWPEARWNVSGAFVFDRILLKVRATLVRDFQVAGYSQVSGAPACLWSGGRSRGVQMRPPAIAEAIKNYDALGLSVNLSFSNVCIEDRHLGDSIGNYALELLNNFNSTGGNGVILGSDRLAEYVRYRYPRLKRIAAVARLTQVEEADRHGLYPQLFGLYDRVILHPDDNFDLTFLGQLDFKDRYEVVVNEACIRHCPGRRLHYELVSRQFHDYLNIDLEGAELDLVRQVGCGHDLRKLLLSAEHRSVTLSTDECQRLYDLGFRNFKIQGRALQIEKALLYQMVHWLLNDNPHTDARTSRLRLYLINS